MGIFFRTKKQNCLPSKTSSWQDEVLASLDSPPKRRCFLRCCMRFFSRIPMDWGNLKLKIDLVEKMVVKEEGREYFSFDGGNVFSWSTKKVSEDQKKALYEMVVKNVIDGVLNPMQKLPEYYHNLILAEAIKGNRANTVVKYLELKK